MLDTTFQSIKRLFSAADARSSQGYTVSDYVPQGRMASAAMAVFAHPMAQRESESVVRLIHTSVLMRITKDAVEKHEMANFNLDQLFAGELNFTSYLERMQNLFPQEMSNLSPDLQSRARNLLQTAH